jgi:acetyl-CoA acetyltransferase
MREVVILGVGMHKFGRFPGKTFEELARDAIRAAMKDAGVTWKDIQALYAGHSYSGTGAGCTVANQMGLTAIPVINIELGCTTGIGIVGLAYQAIAGGFYDVVCAVGFEKIPKGILPADEFPQWSRVTGIALYPVLYAWLAQRFMRDYGVTREQMAKVSIKSHNNAALNPYAHYRDNANLTVEDVLNSRMIADPITVLQIAPVSEGAVATILGAKEIAHRFPDARPINLASFALRTAGYVHPYSFIDFIPQVAKQGRAAAFEAYEKAGVGPEDLDVVACHDAYTIAEMEDYQVLDLCPEGECGKLVDEGATEITGRIPVNTDGGMLSRGNVIGACAMASLAEVVWQLRGEAGPRQVKDPKVGLVYAVGIGPVIGAAILKK